MNYRNLTDYILKEGGCSYSTVYGHLTKGYAVSIYPDRCVRVPSSDFSDNDLRNFVIDNSDLLADTKNFVGAWVDNGNVILDVSIKTTQKVKALRLAKQNKQDAIFDLETKQTIYL